MLNFFGRAPEGAAPDRLRGADREIGVLSVAVPGNLAGWSRVLEDYSTVSLEDALQPAIELAEGGTPVTVFDRQMFGEYHAKLDEQGRRIFLHDGLPPSTGTVVVQRELATNLRMIGQAGIDTFYAGEIAVATCRDLARRSGLITRRDLAEYPETVQWSDALVIDLPRRAGLCASAAEQRNPNF